MTQQVMLTSGFTWIPCLQQWLIAALSESGTTATLNAISCGNFFLAPSIDNPEGALVALDSYPAAVSSVCERYCV